MKTDNHTISKLVEIWDEKNNTQNYTIGNKNSYRSILENIKVLERFRFVPFLNDDVQNFGYKLNKWLDQFETEEEKQIVLVAVSKLTFVTDEQIRYLQEVCYQEKLRFSFLDSIIAEKKLNKYDYESAIQHFPARLNECLFVPLTDSARINQFFHVNDLENHSSMALKSLDLFVHPILQRNPEIKNSINDYYFSKNKNTLIILEDYCGSGKTIISDLHRILKNFPCFKSIYFCPYIITEHAEKIINRIVKKWNMDPIFKLHYGLRISDKMRCFANNSDLFDVKQQYDLKQLCIKYHNKYFFDHKFIGTPRKYPFGYRDMQLLFVMQSNCPNHTLPIFWCSNNGWFPLFRRVQRYS